MPDKAMELRQQLKTWRSKVGAQMPTLNTKYDPANDTFGYAPPLARQQ